MTLPFCSVSFSGTDAHDVPVHRASFYRESFAHEVGVVEVLDGLIASRVYESGTPVVVVWGVRPRFREVLYGYVHSSRPKVAMDSDNRRVPHVAITVVGATRVVRDEVPRNWGRTTLSGVVQTMARENRLGNRVDVSTVRHDSLMQPAQSGWSFIREMAEEEGFMLVPDGTVINFWDIETRTRQLREHAPIFAHGDKTVESFEPFASETNATDREAAKRVAYGLDLSGNLVGASDRSVSYGSSLAVERRPRPRFVEVNRGTPLEDLADTREQLNTRRRQHGRVYQAEAKISAPFPVNRPGDPVIFEGYGRRHSGLWTTDRVEFNLSTSGIRSTVLVSRAESLDDGFRPRFPASRPVARKVARAVLAGGTWIDRTRA